MSTKSSLGMLKYSARNVPKYCRSKTLKSLILKFPKLSEYVNFSDICTKIDKLKKFPKKSEMAYSMSRQPQPYELFGSFLQELRAQKFRSGLAFYKSKEFKFSYSMYADYERGAQLPGVPVVLEIAKALDIPEKTILLKWLQVQVPENLRPEFTEGAIDSLLPKQTVAKTPTEPPRKSIEPSNFENTWVLNQNDKDRMLKHPWLWNFITLLAVNYPNAVAWEHLGVKNKSERSKFIEQYIDRWIEDGHVIVNEQGLRLNQPYCHINQTSPEWMGVRKNNFKIAAEGLLENLTPDAIAANEAHRVVLNRSFSPDQLQKWVLRIKELEKEFFKAPAIESNKNTTRTETHTVLLAIGKRKISLKD